MTKCILEHKEKLAKVSYFLLHEQVGPSDRRLLLDTQLTLAKRENIYHLPQHLQMTHITVKGLQQWR